MASFWHGPAGIKTVSAYLTAARWTAAACAGVGDRLSLLSELVHVDFVETGDADAAESGGVGIADSDLFGGAEGGVVDFLLLAGALRLAEDEDDAEED